MQCGFEIARLGGERGGGVEENRIAARAMQLIGENRFHHHSRFVGRAAAQVLNR